MTTAVIAFDIDGTLRCNCTDTCRDVNEEVFATALLFSRMKNTRLIAWSGGGKKYTQDFINAHDKLRDLFRNNCFDKMDRAIRPDIAVDDQHAFALGKINLIVRAK